MYGYNTGFEKSRWLNAGASLAANATVILRELLLVLVAAAECKAQGWV